MRTVTLLLTTFLLHSATGQTRLYELLPPVPLDGGLFGFDAAPVGDRDADGVPDFSVSDAAGVHIFSGVDGDLLLTLEAPGDSAGFGGLQNGGLGTPVSLIANTNPLIVVGAPAANDGVGRAFAYNVAGALGFEFDSPGGGLFGFSVVDVGDPDGDGYSDIAIGSRTGIGRVYFFDSFSGSLTDSLSSPSPLDASNFGLDIVNLGDINGDGIDDLAVAAPTDVASTLTNAGKVYVFSGATRQFVYELSSPNAEEGGTFGVAIANVGDINDDGRDDLAVSAYAEDAGASNAGRVYVFSGFDGSPLFDLISPLPELNGRFGLTLAGIGDTDGDGLPDIAVGAPLEDNTSGRAYVFGGDERLIATLEPAEGDSVILGVDLVGIGDVNGDGRSDLFVGLPQDDIGAINGAGTAGVWSMPSVVANEHSPDTPGVAGLEFAFPNPFRGSTTIRYELSAATAVHLAVYDALGREVAVLREGTVPAGRHEVTLDAADLATGTYVVALDADGARSALLLTHLE
jgi:hypothetical protein